MFTGIVRYIGAVRQVRPASGGKRLRIDLGPLAEGLAQGDSVAVSGACLTASAIGPTEVEFDIVAETLSRTTLGALAAGDKVNLERAAKLGEALEGHIVQGHVDGIAEVKALAAGHDEVTFAAGNELVGQMVSKGSVCIDGVSVTLVAVDKGSFSVALIPTTLTETTLGQLKVGSKVNVETDIIGKYVLKYLAELGGKASGGGLTLDKLGEAGFL